MGKNKHPHVGDAGLARHYLTKRWLINRVRQIVGCGTASYEFWNGEQWVSPTPNGPDMGILYFDRRKDAELELLRAVLLSASGG